MGGRAWVWWWGGGPVKWGLEGSGPSWVVAWGVVSGCGCLCEGLEGVTGGGPWYPLRLQVWRIMWVECKLAYGFGWVFLMSSITEGHVRIVGVSLDVRVGDSASEGSGGKRGDLLGQGCDHMHGVFTWAWGGKAEEVILRLWKAVGPLLCFAGPWEAWWGGGGASVGPQDAWWGQCLPPSVWHCNMAVIGIMAVRTPSWVINQVQLKFRHVDCQEIPHMSQKIKSELIHCQKISHMSWKSNPGEI